MEGFWRNIRYAVRGMVRQPAVSIAAVACFALGIGANTTMFGVVDRLLLRPPAHVRAPGQVARLYFAFPDPTRGTRFGTAEGYPTYVALRDHVHGFEAVAAYSALPVSVGRGVDARDVPTVLASASFFPLLGVHAALGRFFAPDEEKGPRERVAVLGYDAWRTRYAGDSGVLGRTIDVAGDPYTVIGVAPPDFTGVDLGTVDLWLPLGAGAKFFVPWALELGAKGQSYWLQVIARMRPDATRDALGAEATAAYLDSRRSSPGFERFFTGARVVLGPIARARGPAPSADVRVSLWLTLVAGFVLLIACANVANLLLARGLARSRELAIRVSLGAGRAALAGQLLTERLLLAAAGAACAVVVALWGAGAAQSFLAPDLPRLTTALDVRTLAFTLCVAVGTALLATAAGRASLRQVRERIHHRFIAPVRHEPCAPG